MKNIISASRRTDIPAFFGEWFYNRLAGGEVYVRNPFNPKQISRVDLSRDKVGCFVFWTKDCMNMLPGLSALDGYHYYFQFTLTGYGKDIEPGLRQKDDIVNTLKQLSDRIGFDRVVWRYDPILINKNYTMKFHIESFGRLAESLSGYVEKCVISFIDEYRETKRNEAVLSLTWPTYDDIINLGAKLVKIAGSHGITIESCAEKTDLTHIGIKNGKCIDPELISKITGEDYSGVKRDKLREDCGCVKSVDIGEYNCCSNGCIYCYANYNHSLISKKVKLHSPKSKLLIGELE